MQTDISTEEFSRYQSQLLDLRQAKYAAEEARIRAERHVQTLEKSLAQRSCELADTQSILSRVQRAGDIDTVCRENQALRQKLVNIESSFQLQTSTLRGECERLQSENACLQSALKLVGETGDGSCTTTARFFSESAAVQTATTPIHSTGIQTLPVETTPRRCATIQTEQTVSDLKELDLRLQLALKTLTEKEVELEDITRELVTERLRWGTQHDELAENVEQLEAKTQQLSEQVEILRSELAIENRRNEKVQRELRRQLASAMRSSASTSSLVFVNSTCPRPAATVESDATSNSSFSLCVRSGNDPGSVGALCSDDLSETSSNSNHITPTVGGEAFSEEDFRSLLNRLSEVQEENCSLRRQVTRLTVDLEAKSQVIQRTLFVRPTEQASRNSSSAVFNESDDMKRAPPPTSGSLTLQHPSDLLASALGSVKAKLKVLESATVSSSGPLSPSSISTSPELRGVKKLCEELMTRNIVLEKALEETLQRASLFSPDQPAREF